MKINRGLKLVFRLILKGVKNNEVSKGFFIIALALFIILIFINSVFATLYIVKDQEGNIICITNQVNILSNYKLLGYKIDILGGTEQEIPESIEQEITPEPQVSSKAENKTEPNNFLLTKVDLVDFNASFSPKGDFINVQGTLRNYGKEIIKDAQVNVKCENQKGKIILIKTVDCQPLSIVPGSEAYFNLQLENIERISSFKVYLFDRYLTTEYLKTLMAKVEVVIWSSDLNKAGDYIYFENRGNVLIEKDGEYVFINGTIKNIGDGFMSETSIDIRGVDFLGRLLSTDSCDVNPQEIGQGQIASFKGILARGKGIDDFIIDVNWINPQGNSSHYLEIELK
jgi:hypothetical protein